MMLENKKKRFLGEPQLTGKIALVTGSTSGIGLGIAQELASHGAQVILNSHENIDEVRTSIEAISELTDQAVHFIQADLSQISAIEKMTSEIKAEYGSIDVLVNNAGVQHVSPVVDFPQEQWEYIQSLNLSASFHLCRMVLGNMTDKGWGRIINIASAHGLVASPYKAAYVAAKHGIVGLTKVIALETAEAGVTCNAICPGYVLTPLVTEQITGQAKAHNLPRDQVIRDVILAPQPTKEFVTIEEVSALAAYLCSDAARSITGSSLSIDGGWTAR
ncbi:MAG: 3-hydroxybutyrate dehydrogenase [Rhodospirillales bacterium]|jgi:3-hydroxybutyrate dehydrogenase